MAKVATDIGNQAKSQDTAYQDGLIFFNTTNHSISVDSNNLRTAYGTGLFESGIESTSSLLTYNSDYVDSHFVRKNNLMTTSNFQTRIGNLNNVSEPLCSTLKNISYGIIELSYDFEETHSRYKRDATSWSYTTQRTYTIYPDNDITDYHHIMLVWKDNDTDLESNTYTKVWVEIRDIVVDKLFYDNNKFETNMFIDNCLTVTTSKTRIVEQWELFGDNTDNFYPESAQLFYVYGLI